MQLGLIAVGRKMPAWVQTGTQEYTKRFPKQWQFGIRELAQANSGSVAKNKSLEAGALLSAVPDKSHVVALDNRGSQWSTEQLAQQLQQWLELGKPVNFLVGGPDGLDNTVLSHANQQWCLSPLTFPHPLVRIVVCEQLYRAHSLLINHPYHRA